MTTRSTHTRLDPEVRRELILDAAERVMAGRLPAEVTFEEVAEAAAVSRALVYNYFNDRTGLLVALAERTLARLDREVRAALDPGLDIAGQIEALGQAYIRHARAKAATWTLLARSGLLDHPTVQGARTARVAHIAELWGDTPDARLGAWAVTALFEVSGFNALPDEVGEGDLARFLRDLVAPGLVARGVGPAATAGRGADARPAGPSAPAVRPWRSDAEGGILDRGHGRDVAGEVGFSHFLATVEVQQQLHGVSREGGHA